MKPPDIDHRQIAVDADGNVFYRGRAAGSIEQVKPGIWRGKHTGIEVYYSETAAAIAEAGKAKGEAR